MEEKIIAILAEVQKGIMSASPEVLDVTLKYIQLKAGFSIVGALLAFLAGLYFAREAIKELRTDKDFYSKSDAEQGITIAKLVVGGVGGFVVLLSSAMVLNSSLWITLIDPRVGLAGKIFEKIVGN